MKNLAKIQNGYREKIKNNQNIQKIKMTIRSKKYDNAENENVKRDVSRNKINRRKICGNAELHPHPL